MIVFEPFSKGHTHLSLQLSPGAATLSSASVYFHKAPFLSSDDHTRPLVPPPQIQIPGGAFLWPLCEK